MSNRDDLDWLVDEAGLPEDVALELQSVFDWAEMKRVIDRFGYPKDNAGVPFIIERLRDDTFVERCKDVLKEMSDEANEAFEQAVSVAREPKD